MKKLTAFLLIASLVNANSTFRPILSALKRNPDSVALAAGLLTMGTAGAITVDTISKDRAAQRKDRIEKEGLRIVTNSLAQNEICRLQQQIEQIEAAKSQQIEAAKNASWGRGYFNRAVAYATKNPEAALPEVQARAIKNTAKKVCATTYAIAKSPITYTRSILSHKTSAQS